MTEIELLKKLVALENEQYSLEIKIDIWSRDKEVAEFKTELAEINREIAIVEKSLVEIEDKKYSKKAKSLMLDQIHAYITEINKAKDGLKLTRNQGLILENYLFSGILTDLRYYIIDENFGYRIPAYLHYTYEEKKSVEIKPLSDFLKNESRNLSQIENPDYIKLRNFYEEFKNRLLKTFVE
ncbi:hypothetical protein [Neotamlana laminarinivorans]|uniref:Uncharacterized protein n=1 Tax=Neotamlana laminarinivorans TaxID=2883124 RepID=A0A9X1L2Z1_9FLAO|nr:hypothetical protein [Tamlana laminarinivorans]MCB4800295.1 hypothetical protein [Tamlana laminarinivorans]